MKFTDAELIHQTLSGRTGAIMGNEAMNIFELQIPRTLWPALGRSEGPNADRFYLEFPRRPQSVRGVYAEGNEVLSKQKTPVYS